MSVFRLVLLLGLLLCLGAQFSNAQHWSHGWYPGGKRELDSFGTSEVRIVLFPFQNDCGVNINKNKLNVVSSNYLEVTMRT